MTTEETISHKIMIYAEMRKPDRMNQFAVEEIIREELATLRAKSEAWDKGVERLAVYNGKGDFMWTDNYLEKPQNADLPVGCHYRKVKVCEVVE